MKRLEVFGALIVALVVLGTPAGVFAYQTLVANTSPCKTIIMRTYEHGNPMPEETHVKKGEKVCLRITSYDVTHGFVISDLGIDAGEIHPGKWTTIEFTPQETGTYSFVCSIRCSPMHSHVRGVIMVEE